MAESAHIAFISSAGFTHLFPVIEFSKRLIQLHPNLQVTCIIPILESLPSSSQSYLQSLPPNIHSILLPPVHKHDMPKNVHRGAQVQLAVTLSLPYIHQELKSLISRSSSSSPLVALVTDCFAHEALDFASEFNLLSFVYLPYAAMILSLYLCNSTKLDDGSEFKDLTPESIDLPPCIPVRGREIVDSIYDDLVRKQFFERAKKLSSIDGVLFNSFLGLETETIRSLQEQIREKNKPQIYPVGPITPSPSGDDTNLSDSTCLTWLNNQQPKSVLYVSFGSGGTLSQEQLNELAFGLELSGKKFLWVVRPPSDDVSAAYLSTSSDKNPLDYLPNGFIERTKDQGLVVPSWAPQIPILSHNSVGGFLSHCGWNSTMESIVHGVPIVAWPLFAEQRMNAAFLTDCLRVALWPEPSQRGMVERDEIRSVIIRFMEGEEGREVRRRMEDLKISAANALKEDGSSTQTLFQFVMSFRDRACLDGSY